MCELSTCFFTHPNMDKLLLYFSWGLVLSKSYASHASEFPLQYVGAVCVDNIYSAVLPPSLIIIILLFSSFNNRGHGRAALWKSASSHCRVFPHALEMNSESCLKVFLIIFFFSPTALNQKSQKKTITLFRPMLCDSLGLMHNWWASVCRFPELLGDMWWRNTCTKEILSHCQIIHHLQVKNQEGK